MCVCLYGSIYVCGLKYVIFLYSLVTGAVCGLNENIKYFKTITAKFSFTPSVKS